jgi:hypothetical protein
MNLVTSEVALAVETAIVDQMQLDVPVTASLFSFDARMSAEFVKS